MSETAYERRDLSFFVFPTAVSSHLRCFGRPPRPPREHGSECAFFDGRNEAKTFRISAVLAAILTRTQWRWKKAVGTNEEPQFGEGGNPQGVFLARFSKTGAYGLVGSHGQCLVRVARSHRGLHSRLLPLPSIGLIGSIDGPASAGD